MQREATNDGKQKEATRLSVTLRTLGEATGSHREATGSNTVGNFDGVEAGNRKSWGRNQKQRCR